jgi:hypothetical protein
LFTLHSIIIVDKKKLQHQVRQLPRPFIITGDLYRHSVGVGGNEVAKDNLNEEIDNQEPYPFQELVKWMKKEEFNNRQKRWERDVNDMKHQKVSVSWQNDTVELSWKEQVVISRLRTG